MILLKTEEASLLILSNIGLFMISNFNISNNEEVNFTITHISIEFKTEFYGLKKRIIMARRNGFILNQINKLTIKSYSIK